MYKIKNSNIPFVTLSKENMFTICNSLEYEEIGLIFKAFMDFVYFGIEPTFEKKYMQGIFDGVLQTMERKAEGCFASRENGKKGGRKPKNNTELQPNTEIDTEAKISPNQPDLTANDIDIPQGGESLPEAKIEAKEEEIIIDTDNTEDMGTFIGTLSNFATAETRRIEHEEDRSMEHMMKCLSTFDISKAKHQVFKSRTIDDNMKRVADCLDPLLGGFSKTERSKLYISIIEDALNSN